MRTLVSFLVLVLCTACHKEFVSHSEAPVLSKVKAAVKAVLPTADYQQIDWNQSVPVTAASSEVVAYHVSLSAFTANTYRFLLVNVSDDSIGGVYANEVLYEDLHGGKYPVLVRNHHLQSGRRHAYSTRGQLVREWTVGASLSPAALMSGGLRLPMVTLTGIFRPAEGDGKTARMAHVDSYILAAALGFEETITYDRGEPHQASGVLYYDPLQGARAQPNSRPLIAWNLL